jgi:putative MATE family efflux protein
VFAILLDSYRLRRILALGLPIIGGMVSQNILNLVDTAMVGTLGDAALAAVGIGGFTLFMCQALILGISTGVQATAARRKGEGEEARAATVLNTALALVLVIGPLFSMVLFWVIPHLFPLINDDPEVMASGIPYLGWRIMAITFVGMNFAFRGYWNAMDQSSLYMLTLIVMHACNIFFNWIFIFGNLGAPALGAEGAGLSSAMAMVIGSAVYFYLGIRFARRNGFLAGLLDRKDAKTLVRLSIPTGIQQLFFSTGFVVTFWIIGRIGTAEVAAANVLINVTLVALLPGLALGMASATLVGQALGRRDVEDAYRWGWDVVKVAVVVMGGLGVPMWLAPDLISSGFIHDPETRALARWPMRIVGLGMPLEAIGFVLMHSLLGAGDAKRVALVSIGYQWLLFLPLAFLVGPTLGFGLVGVWLLQGSYRILMSGTFALMWRRGGWRRIQV